MTERQLLKALTAQIKKELPEIFWYKIPDVPTATTKKPFDVVAVYDGKTFAIEFKKEMGGLLPHQKKALQQIEIAGGYSFIGTFTYNGKHDRTIVFNRFGDDKSISILTYRQGKYQGLEYLLFFLDKKSM